MTGASSGIGRATAEALGRRGAQLFLTARREEQLAEVIATVEGSGGSAIALAADLTAPRIPAEVVEQCVSHFGRLDIAINNAGIMLLGPAAEAPLEEWDRMLELNVWASLAVAHAALPHLKSAAQSGRGVADLVNISSAAGRVARAGSAVYNLTKFGLGAFSESLRQEMTKANVRVALVEPGVTATQLRQHMRPEVERLSANRFAGVEKLLPSDIAEAITYIVEQPRRVAINEILIRPTDQAD